MAMDWLELAKVAFSFLGGATGAISGAVLKNQWSKREQRQTRWLPLLEATKELKENLRGLSNLYKEVSEEKRWTKAKWLPTEARDFWELYTLNGDPDPASLQDSKLEPDGARSNRGAVNRVRIRMCHELNRAASVMYATAKYLAYAQRVRTDLNEGRLHRPWRLPLRSVTDRLSTVRGVLHGTSITDPGAGIITEQQDSIGVNTWSKNDNGVISYSEFQSKLLLSPGWEQFIGLFRFFLEIDQKLDTEVKQTIDALEDLRSELDRVFGHSSKVGRISH